MTENRRPLSELLRDADLYTGPAPAAGGAAWRSWLLDERFPLKRSRKLRPTAGLPPFMRLLLLVALPMALLLGIGLATTLGLSATSLQETSTLSTLVERGVEQLGRSLLPGTSGTAPAGAGSMLRLFFWPALVGASAFFTFLARRRPPRLLPLDW